MKKMILVLLCIVALVAFACTSCDFIGNGSPDVDNTDEGKTPSGGNQDNVPGDTSDGKNDDQTDGDCVHTYSSKWSTNSKEHWHASTCEHTGLKSEVASHTDSDEDGECDICLYEVGHEHTFSDEWTTDETHHWKLGVCSHTTEKSELGEHTDSDSDGACDSCSVHMHVVDLFGMCTVCGEKVADIDVTDFGVIIPIVVSNANKINSGSIKYNNVCTSVEQSSSVYASKDVLYVLGNGAAYYKVSSKAGGSGNSETYADIQENWYELIDSENVFGVYRVNSGDIISGVANLDNLKGFYFSVSTFAGEYGPEDLLEEVFKLSQSSSASNYVSEYSDGKYSFSFGYLYVNRDTAEGNHVDYFELEVSFSLSESGALIELNVVCNAYSNSTHSELDHDYTYDPDTNTITMKDNAVADVYSFEITQTEGERTYVSEYPLESFIPDDFDIFTDAELTEKVEGSLNVEVNKVFTLYLGNFVPEGTSISFVADTFKVTCDSSNIYCGEVAISSSVIINVKKAGTYTIVIHAADVSKEITITATNQSDLVDPTPENTVKVEITDNNAWEDLAVFTASKDGDYTFTIAPELYLGAKGEKDKEPWADFNIRSSDTLLPIGGSITVSLKAGESYKFYVMATEKGITVYIPYTVSDYTGSSDENKEEVVIGSSITSGTNNAAFTEAEIEANSAVRTLTVTTDGNYAFNCVLFVSSVTDSKGNVITHTDYKYPLVAGETYTVTFGMFNLYGVEPNTYVTIDVVNYSQNLGGSDEQIVVQGTYIGTDASGNTYLTVIIEGSTVTFVYEHPMFGSNTVVATITTDGVNVILYDEDGNPLHPLSGTLTIDENGNPTSASYNDVEYTLTPEEDIA